MFVAGHNPEEQVAREDIKAYQAQLKHYLAGVYPETSAGRVEKVWARLQSKAKPALDSQGHPILEMQVGEKLVRVGVSASNIMSGNAPPDLVRQLLEARLGSELRHPSTCSCSLLGVTLRLEAVKSSLGRLS